MLRWILRISQWRSDMYAALIKLLFFILVSMCAGTTITLNNATGTITSPNYPENYGPEDSASYVINAPSDHVIFMAFYLFETANNGILFNSDYLSVRYFRYYSILNDSIFIDVVF